jgi:RNA polymerase sigma-70 factor (ECF subfamily)
MEFELRRQAVERAYRAHRDDVYRVAFAILRDPDAAVDATHDAFARAFERWEQYDERRPLRPWLHGIVAHQALDALRRQHVRRIALPGIVERPPAQDGADPQAIVGERVLVDEALATLPPLMRAALVLRHYYGYDYAEIGAQLATSPGNVGSMLSRAHAALRRRLVATADASSPPAEDAPHRAAR